ncbi:MAG: hypothetical protein IJ217_03910 [Clostridia bacterium]|nr:hypothetical protein [Clostridia bacterium]
MSEMQKQIVMDITSMAPFVNVKIAESIKNLMETEIEQEILKINPDVVFDDMDITEKLMLLEYISKSEEEREKDAQEAIPLEEILKAEGLNDNDLHD